MKLSKIKFLGIALFVAAMVFMGCDSPSGGRVITDVETKVPTGYYVDNTKGVYIYVKADGTGEICTKQDNNWKSSADVTLTKVVYYTSTLSSCDCLGKNNSGYFKGTYNINSKEIKVNNVDNDVTITAVKDKLKGATLTYLSSQPTGSSS